jgi:hydrogenase maturation protease
MQAPTLIFAWGNPSRGDDALGPEFLRRIEPLAGEGVELVTDFQLQVEHAVDIARRELVLFVDASTDCAPPFALSRVGAQRHLTFTTHAMSPAAVLHVYRAVTGKEPPPTYLLAIRGERFELGEDLSASAREHLHAALEFAARLLSERSAEAWDRHVLHCG